MLNRVVRILLAIMPGTIRPRGLLITILDTARKRKSTKTLRRKTRAIWDVRLSNDITLFVNRIRRRMERLMSISNPDGHPEKVSKTYPRKKARNQLPVEG